VKEKAVSLPEIRAKVLGILAVFLVKCSPCESRVEFFVEICMYTFLQGKDLNTPPLSHKLLDKNCGKG